MFVFKNPLYFWLGVCLAVLFFTWSAATFKRIKKYRRLDIARSAMWSAIIFFLGLVLAESAIFLPVKLPVKERLEIVFCLDASLSSLAIDIETEVNGESKKISRLEFQKRLVEELSANLKDDAVGIIAFAAEAIPLQIALVREDYKNTFLRNLKNIDNFFVRRGIIQGTDYGKLLEAALEQFQEPSLKKLLIILTDGEQQGDNERLKENLNRALESFSQEKSIVTYFVSVGNANMASPIPKSEDKEGKPKDYYKHEKGEAAGQLILTRPHPEFLSQLANAVNGYFIEAKGNEKLKTILKEVISKERRIIGHEEKNQKNEIGFYLVTISLLFLFVIPLIKTV